MPKKKGMEEAPKSAFDIAMEKLHARDRERGEAPVKELTREQKDRIAEVRKTYEAKLAEREILHQADLKKTMGDPEKRREAEETYVEDRRRMEAKREEKIAEIRG
jgi:hypothetical protein